MAKKKIKLTEDEKEELESEGELPKKSLRNREERQLIWFFVIIGIIFGVVLVSYFWVEGAKSFEYGGANWVIEDYENLRIYHGRFSALSGANLIFNVYLRIDPRKNNVQTEGTFDKFKYGAVISLSPEVDECRGELSRVMLDLGSFLKEGIGVSVLETGSSDKFVAVKTDRRHALCNTVADRTIVIVDIGESKVIQDEENSYCYTIYAEDCNDLSSVEKFIVKSVDDFSRRE